MADDVAITAGSGTNIATDDCTSGHVQLVKIAYSADGNRTHSTVDANGVLVQFAGEVVEDANHSAGETLVGVAARRIDSPASSAGSDTDWSTLNNDSDGLAWARPIEKPRTVKYDLVTQASAVAANDQLCDEMELTSMTLVAGGGGKLLNLVLVSYNTTQIAAEGWIYAANPTPAGTNSVHNQTDANMAASLPIAVVDFSTWITETDNIMSTGVLRGMPLGASPIFYDCADGTNTSSLWIVMVTRTAVTPGATTDYDLFVTHVPLA